MFRRVYLLLTFLVAIGAAAQASQPPLLNVVSFDTSASLEVPTDTLTMTLFTEEQGPEPTELAAKVNARIERALARANTATTVQAHSGDYHTYPIYDRENEISGWRLRAEIILQSRDFKAVGALAGALQPELKLASMNFSLSREAREHASSTLLVEALDKYRKKARVIAETLGFPGYSLGEISVRGDANPPPLPVRPLAMKAMAEPSGGPVPAEGGSNLVSVTVSGSIMLGPAK